jgi:hypothetical protein
MIARGVLLWCLAAPLTPAWAATIGGQVTSDGFAPLVAFQVLLLSDPIGKGWVVGGLTTTDGSGTYSFSGVAPGSYSVQVVAENVTGKCFRANRYYDVLPPVGSGLDATADVLTVEAATVLTDVDITMPNGGALEATVTTSGGTGLGGLQVRVESASDSRIHVDGSTSAAAGTLGMFTVCGLNPGQHRVWIHHPNASYEDRLLTGPYTVFSGMKTTLANQTMSAVATDPYEPNDSLATGQSLPASPDLWESSLAIISPRATDVDFFCFDALAGERYVVTATTGVLFASELRPSPWVDPFLGFYRTSPVQLLATNDDDPSGEGPFDSRISTGDLPADARYCVAVTTYGDSDFNGSGQGSAGRYVLRVAAEVVAIPLFDDGFESGDLGAWSSNGDS